MLAVHKQRRMADLADLLERHTSDHAVVHGRGGSFHQLYERSRSTWRSPSKAKQFRDFNTRPYEVLRVIPFLGRDGYAMRSQLLSPICPADPVLSFPQK